MAKNDKRIQMQKPVDENSEKTVHMIFSQDMFYGTELKYQKGKEYPVPESMVQRWLKRGGQIVEDKKPAPVDAKPVAPPPQKPDDKKPEPAKK